MAHTLPIIPFFLFASIHSAIVGSLIISIVMLFLLGYYIGKINESDGFGGGVKYVVLGFASAIIAFILGELLKHMIMEGRFEVL